MIRHRILALLTMLVVGACSTEPAREQAVGAPAPAEGAAAEPGLDAGAPVPGGAGIAPGEAPAGPEPAAGAAGGGSAAQGGPVEPPRSAQPAGAAGRGESPGGTAAEAAASAQPPAPADEGASVLRRAAAAYENVSSLRADFVMNFENPLLRQSTTSRGTIYQRQPDRIALRFSEPDGDVILSDGQYFWVYYPSVNAQQVIRSPASAGGESGVNLQAQFVGNPVERFNYELHGSEAVGGRSAHVLTLVPRQRAEYRSLKVWLDARDSLARRFEITEHNGSVRRFDLQNMQVNPTIPESVFRFTPPDGARIVSTG